MASTRSSSSFSHTTRVSSATSALLRDTRIAPLWVRFSFWGGTAALVALGTWFCLDSALNLSSSGSRGGEDNASAMVTLRVATREGHPIPGARVLIASNQIGITDAFGEMRRQMRVPLGGTLAFRALKDTGGGQLEGHREVGVSPAMPREGLLEVRANLVIDALQRARGGLAQKPRASDSPSSGEQPALVGPTPESWSRIWVTYDQSDAASIPSALRESDRARARLLRTGILPILQREVSEWGLTLDESAPWIVRVRDLPLASDAGDVVGLVKVSVTRQLGQQHWSREFVTTYESGNIPTARKIASFIAAHSPRPYALERQGDRWSVRLPANATSFWALDSQAPLQDPEGKTFRLVSGVTAEGRGLLSTANDIPCVSRPAHIHSTCWMVSPPVPDRAPHAGWRAYKFKIAGKEPSDISVFAGAYKATRNSRGEWNYFAPSVLRATTTLTVVRGERVISRLNVRDNPARPLAINARMINSML